jgi:16S rRNA (adenine1518-N6/adenine1519-N6)-dimethyltransferase
MIISKIIGAISPAADDHLVEIGPGQGAITEHLLALAGRLDAIELDRDLVALLQRRFAGTQNFTLHSADALKFDFCSLQTDQQLRLVGNLPYNISTPIMFHLLEQPGCIRDMYFMLQKEVVDRMAAPPGSKTYGRLSVMLQLKCQVTPLFKIGPGAFSPPPKVESAFVRLQPWELSPYQIDDLKFLERLVTQAFSQRRKTLRNSLKKLVDPAVYDGLDIDPGRRAEQLAPADFVRLANAVEG